MDGSSRGDGTYAHRHYLGSIKSVQYAPVLVCRFYLHSFSYNFPIIFNHPFLLQLDGVHRLVLRSLVFLRRFSKRPGRAKLVNPDTIHWYCDDLEPTPEAVKHNAKIRRCKSVDLIFLKWLLALLVNNFIHPSLQRWTTLRGER